ncbi:MAG: leucine-rich repeat domain-containing protein, partial [Candidatus Poribacteria bacterium]|nr:leucine-rich repeat domain-containing protein [Candidatus Poribacteria bacterium]
GQMESVMTPAGDFDALKIEMASSWAETGTSYTASGTVTQTWWVVEHIGVVRLDYAYTEKYTEDGETENDGGDVSFLLASSTLLELPVISTQPVNTTATATLPAELSVVATGPGILEYQWFKDVNTPVGGKPTFTIAEAAESDAGSYVVHITNHNGTTISETVTLTVEVPEVIDIPDTFLKREILRANGKFEGDVTRADLENLQVLEASRLTNLKDLTGLEYAINLTDLRLSRNAITDLSPLAGLTQMKHLRLGNNMISSIEPLANLVNLEVLDVSANLITDLGPVANMPELTTLAASINQIESIEPLRGRTKLVEVYISMNAGISDLSPISEIVRIQKLTASQCSISDITPLSGLINLKALDLATNQI